MGLVDSYSFTARAGKGGDGVVRWRREKFLPKGGPAGGNGGRGGDFCVRGIRDIFKIGRISHIRSYAAQDGEDGGSNSCTGKAGVDLVLDLPVGSVITKRETGERWELIDDGGVLTLLSGGRGGKGNESFKSAQNRAPYECTKGEEGGQGTFDVELRLIANIGLIGLPNAGKTSLLNELSNARAKIGPYPFTTLSPNLGTCAGLVIADIPGLIEGAHEGKGLGQKFLRHIARTSVLVHCISSERDTMIEDYFTVRTEIAEFEEGSIANKREIIIFTKSDTVSSEKLAEKMRDFSSVTGKRVDAHVSVLDTEAIAQLPKLFLNALSQ